MANEEELLEQGAICLDTLGSGWSPVQTIKTALLSLRLLLEFPNPKDPQDAEVASMLSLQPEQFVRKAKDWSVKYAGAKADGDLDLNMYNKPGDEKRPPAPPS